MGKGKNEGIEPSTLEPQMTLKGDFISQKTLVIEVLKMWEVAIELRHMIQI